MYIFGVFIEKRTIFKVVLILLVIIGLIIMTNIRINKNKITRTKFETPSEQIDGGDAYYHYGVVIYDFDKIMPYFTDTKGALDFQEYLTNVVQNSGTQIQEWWITNIKFNETALSLTFDVASNDKEYFTITKSNEGMKVNYTHKNENYTGKKPTNKVIK